MVARANELAKQFGRRAALHDLQLRVLNKLMPFQVLKGMTATADEIDKRLLDAGGLETRFCTRDELYAAMTDAEMSEEMTIDFIEAALAKGDECYGIFDGQKLVSMGWYSNQPTPLSDNLTLCFDRSWMYMYKGYTLRAYRGKRLHGVGMSLALYAYTKRGARGLISYVKSNNFQSLRSTERMGYRIFGDIYIAQPIGRSVTWSTPGCAEYDFRVEPRSKHRT
ncbi:MAG: GNAT family acetyltransferase [Kofleriaceae bacterium]|nr:GNAT family acetyltransferase [Kofleriaceae bacterium]